MPINFPNSPSNGATHTVGNITYVYDSSKGVWKDSPAGLTQGIDALTDVDISTSAPTNGQILEYNSTSGKFVPADSSAGVTVYATINDLPLSGVTEGSMALVDSTDKLYIFSDSGWYSIALVNTSPSISGVATAYTLSTTGSATVVTITGSDPEGLPLTYSIVSDTSGNIATVSQGTGSNTNVFTITPSTNSAHVGTFSLTFRASDGVNIASATSSFTLEFQISNSKYTTALITSVGANNKTNTSDFTDKASTPLSWTNPSSRARQTTFSPYRAAGYSVYGDESDAVKFTETSANEFTFGTGDFTIEFWIWLDYDPNASNILGNGAERTLCGNNGVGSNRYDGEMWFSVTNYGNSLTGGEYNFQVGNGGWATTIRTTGTAANKFRQWVHLAVTCKDVSGTRTINIWENGTSVASGTTTVNIPNSGSQMSFLGRPQTYGQYTKGYIHDVRVTKGSAEYTSSFSVPTVKSVSGSNTTLLALRKPFIADELTNPLVGEIAAGDPTMEPFTPYDYETYSSSLYAGSLEMPSGTLASLEISETNGSVLELGNSDFSMECWLYRTGASPSSWGILYLNGDGSHMIDTQTDDIPRFRWTNSGQGSGWQNVLSSNDEAPLNMWTHILVTRDSNTLRIFRDGVLKNSTSLSASIKDLNASKYLGGGTVSSQTLPGYLADFRLIKGSVPSGYQTSSTTAGTRVFTPPTEPVSNVTNTVTLMQFDEAAIVDKSQMLEKINVYGNVKSSNAQTKNSSTSIAFDGSGDYLYFDSHDHVPNRVSGTDFTIEFWIYLNNISAEQNIIETGTHGAASGWTVYVLGSSGRLDMYPNHTNLTTLAAQTWYHVAIENFGGTIKCFIDGTSTYSASMVATSPVNSVTVGSRGQTGNYLNGYMEDLRLTKGYARYQGTNFTAPSAPLKG